MPEELVLTDGYEIGEYVGDGEVTATRILLSPSECYLNDEIVQLEDVIHEIVRRYNFAFKLFQLHHQNKKDYSTEFVSQASICCQKHMNLWWEQVAKDHPLPEGHQWMICNEDLLVAPFNLRNFQKIILLSLTKKFDDNLNYFLKTNSYKKLLESILVF